MFWDSLHDEFGEKFRALIRAARIRSRNSTRTTHMTESKCIACLFNIKVDKAIMHTSIERNFRKPYRYIVRIGGRGV